MKNELKLAVGLSYFNVFITLVIGLIYTPLMLRFLGQSEYGLYSLIGVIVSYLSVLDMGIGNTIVRYLANNRIKNDVKKEAELNGFFLLLYLLIGIITIAIGYILYQNIEYAFSSSLNNDELIKAKTMLVILIFNFALTFPLSVFASIMQSYEKFVFLRMSNIIRVLFNPLITLPLLYFGYGSIMMVGVSTLLNIVCLCVNVYYCFTFLKTKFKIGHLEIGFLKEVTIYSFFIFLNAIMDKIYWGTGQFILGIFSGTLEVAIYAIAVQFIMMYMQFSTAISNVLLPKITIMVANNCDNNALTALMVKTGRLQYIIVGYIFMLFYLVGKDFLSLWAGDNYISAYPIILILMAGLFIALLQNAGISILQAKNLNKYRMTVYTITAFLNLIISIPLAKLYSGLGCAISTTIALIFSTGFIMNWYYNQTIKINIYLFWKNILQMSKPLLVLFIFGTILDMLSGVYYNWIVLLAKIAIYTVLYCIVMFFYGMNSYESNLCRSFIVKLRRGKLWR